MKTENNRLVPDRIPPRCDEVDKFTAFSLIKAGIRLGDDLMKRIGQARVRFLEDRATDEDLDLLNIKLK